MNCFTSTKIKILHLCYPLQKQQKSFTMCKFVNLKQSFFCYSFILFFCYPFSTNLSVLVWGLEAPGVLYMLFDDVLSYFVFEISYIISQTEMNEYYTFLVCMCQNKVSLHILCKQKSGKRTVTSFLFINILCIEQTGKVVIFIAI